MEWENHFGIGTVFLLVAVEGILQLANHERYQNDPKFATTVILNSASTA